MIGANHTGVLLTLVDRNSRLTQINKLPEKSANTTARAVIKSLASLEGEKHSITMEFSAHDLIATQSNISVFFAHPYSSYERGTNENTNGLIRQYFPKQTDLSKIPASAIKKVENLLNHRLRKVLGFKTPFEVYRLEDIVYFSDS
jgi:IS30 family transposase